MYIPFLFGSFSNPQAALSVPQVIHSSRKPRREHHRTARIKLETWVVSILMATTWTPASRNTTNDDQDICKFFIANSSPKKVVDFDVVSEDTGIVGFSQGERLTRNIATVTHNAMACLKVCVALVYKDNVFDCTIGTFLAFVLKGCGVDV